MHCRYLLTLILLLPLFSSARDFSESFADSTLRIDYVLTGDSHGPSVSMKKMMKSPIWYGRKVNLERTHHTGYDDITITSLSGDTLYRNSYSSLFNEWLDLSDSVPSAHEATVLVPMPKSPVRATFRVLDKRHQPIATISHTIDPKDILIRQSAKKPLDYIYLHKGDFSGQKIPVAILPEGYTADEMQVFIEDANATVDAILEHEPFNELRDRFDFLAVMAPSRESGVSIPKLGLWKETAFNSHFSTFYSDRYLTTGDVFAINDALIGIPYQHIIILANTDEYGGGGIFNDYTLTAAHHPLFRPVVVHEFGHSFGGLADEYFYDGDVMDNTYPLDVEPWEPNITTLIDFDSKWKSIIPESTPTPTDPKDADKYPVGLYEGGGYSFKGVYRPADICRMRVNDIDHFCPACQKALKELIIYYTEK